MCKREGAGRYVAALSQVGADSTCAQGKHRHWRQRPVHGLLLGRKLLLQAIQHRQDPPYGAVTPHHQHTQACNPFQPLYLDIVAAAAALNMFNARLALCGWSDAHTRPCICVVFQLRESFGISEATQ